MPGECLSTFASGSGRGKRKDGKRSAWGKVRKDICADAGLAMDDATIKRGAQLHSSWARKAPLLRGLVNTSLTATRVSAIPRTSGLLVWSARDGRIRNERGSTVEAGHSHVGSRS